MKQNILLLLTLLIFQFCYSQEFETVFTDEEVQFSTDILEVSDGYIISLTTGNLEIEPNRWGLKLLKIDKKGNKIKSVSYNERVFTTVSHVTKLTDTSFLFNYIFFSADEDSLRCGYRVLNNDLEEFIYEEENPEIAVKNIRLCFSKVSQMPSGSIIHSFYSYQPPSQKIHLIKTNALLSEFSQAVYNANSAGVNIGAIPYVDSDTLLCFLHSKAYKIDSNLNLSDSLPEDFFLADAGVIDGEHYEFMIQAYSIARMSDESLVTSGSLMHPFLVQFNKDLTQRGNISLEHPRTDTMSMGYFESMSAYNDKIFVAYTNGRPLDGGGYYYPYIAQGSDPISYIQLYKLDANLNLVWKKSYNKDNGYHHFVTTVLATEDGGCLVSSFRSNPSTQGMRVDLYLMKVNPEGLDISEETVQAQTKIYPNPGTAEFTISTETIGQGTELYMYDLSGRTVIYRNLNGTTETIDASFLPSGIYMYEIRNKGAIQDRGKWIKIQ